MKVRAEADGEGCAGFSLVETMIGLSLFALLVASSIPVFIGTIRSSNGLGTKQTGITIANQRLEYARSIAPASLVKGRHATDVAALIAAPTLADLSNDVTASGNSDPAAVLGSAAAVVPLTTTPVAGGDDLHGAEPTSTSASCRGAPAVAPRCRPTGPRPTGSAST